jgi:phosphoglycolate phosphatase-like HAD superfamily hydrolase
VHQFFDFDSGAYGCDHWDRNALGHVAIERASKRHGHAPSQFEVTVIGDTPKDIACGKAAGARTIAVATGGYSADELARHDPDHVLEDFTALADVVALLLGEIPEQ